MVSWNIEKDNSSLRDFGYNSNSIRNQGFRPIAGNVRGNNNRKIEFSNESNSPGKKQETALMVHLFSPK